MKTFTYALVATAFASPALAHGDRHLHFHGEHIFMILAALGAAAALFQITRK